MPLSVKSATFWTFWVNLEPSPLATALLNCSNSSPLAPFFTALLTIFPTTLSTYLSVSALAFKPPFSAISVGPVNARATIPVNLVGRNLLLDAFLATLLVVLVKRSILLVAIDLANPCAIALPVVTAYDSPTGDWSLKLILPLSSTDPSTPSSLYIFL